MTATPDFETVIVTCQKDFAKLQCLLHSIEQHGLGHGNETVHIVVNDHLSCLHMMKDIVPGSARYLIWHCGDLGDWSRPRYWHESACVDSAPWDWHSQQWFKLVASRIVRSDWYLVLDSDIVLKNNIAHQHLFQGNRAYYKQTAIDFSNDYFLQLLSSAYSWWNHSVHDHQYHMSDSTPFMMHTGTVAEMLTQISQDLFYPMNNNRTAEFFLYSAYLDHCGIKDKLYVAQSLLSWPTFLTHSAN